MPLSIPTLKEKNTFYLIFIFIFLSQLYIAIQFTGNDEKISGQDCQ